MPDLEKLDPYGHLTWTIGTGDDSPGDEWIACFDARYNPHTNRIDYEVVIDSGSSVDTPESDSIDPNDESSINYLKGLPETYSDDLAPDVLIDEQSLLDTMASWATHIDSLVAQAISPEDEEAAVEQTADYFDRHIAGDR